jgi:hypothetical protein
MGSMAEMLKMQAQELLLCNELMGQELEEVIIGVQTVLLSWLNLDKTQLAREMTQATPRTKSALIQNFIMNSFVTTDGSLLPENVRIDLSGFDLTRVDLRGMDLHQVNFDRCCVEEMNITEAVASPEQFSQACGITTLITTSPQFIADLQALQFAALCTPIVAMVNALETVEDEIAIHELLHRLEQQEVECNSLTDVELAQLTLHSLNSSRLNLLDEKERCCYTRIAPQLAANGTEAFLSQSREVHQALLVSALDKLNLPLAAQTIAVEKLNKLIALENRLIANGFLQRHRIKEKMHDLTSEQCSQLTGLLEHWKKQEHLAAEKIRAVRIQYEAHYFATLYRPIVENQKSPK